VGGRDAVSALGPTPSRAPLATAATDGDGLVRFDRLPPGRYLRRASTTSSTADAWSASTTDGPGPGLAFAVSPPDQRAARLRAG
jgi:hypothetical protein